MPNIREYNSPEEARGIQPSDLGSNALIQEGRRIESVYHQMGQEIGGGVATLGQAGARIGQQIDQHNAMQEISTGAAALANITSKLTDSWNDTANGSDLNDHTIADKFRQEQLEPALEQWQAGFKTEAGQKWALERADALRSHMFEKTSADMATRAGDALVANLNTTLNASSNMARNDPSSLEFAKDQYASAVRAAVANSGAPPAVASKMLTESLEKGNSQIAMSAGIGLAEKNPDALDAEVNKGTYNNDLDAEKQRQLQGYAQTQRTHAKTQAVENSQDLANQAIISAVDPNTKQFKQITPDMIGQVAMNPNIRKEDKTSTVTFLTGVMKSQAEGVKASDPAVLKGFRDRAASGDPLQMPTVQEIGRQAFLGNLSPTDARNLHQDLLLMDPKQNKDPEATELLKGAQQIGQIHILGSGNTPGQASAADLSRLQRFKSWLMDAYKNGVMAGKTPQQLLTPGTPDYLVSPENLRFFDMTGDDLVKGAPQGSVGAALMPPGAKQPTAIVQQRKPLSSYFGGVSGTQ